MRHSECCTCEEHSLLSDFPVQIKAHQIHDCLPSYGEKFVNFSAFWCCLSIPLLVMTRTLDSLVFSFTDEWFLGGTLGA